ncbi:MAG: HlyD family efflux transporter periplasmic adaptor subunit [Acidobacteriota bacterium]
MPPRSLVTETIDQALNHLAEASLAVVALGPELPGETALEFLHRALATRPDAETTRHLYIVLAAGPELAMFQALIDHRILHYLCTEPPDDAEIAVLVESACRALEAWWLIPREHLPPGLRQDLLREARQLASMSSVAGIAKGMAETLQRYVDADRVVCRVFDEATDTLWHPDRDNEEIHDSAAAGLTSFALRSGMTLSLPRIDDDPRHDLEADNLEGKPTDRYLAVPIPGRDAPTVAVLVATRQASRPEFSDADQQFLERFAHIFGPLIEQAAQHEALTAASQHEQVFRRQALEHHARGTDAERDLLRISPAWLSRTYQLLLALLVVFLLFTSLTTFHEYASGVAMVRADGHTDVTARVSGTALEIAVSVGDRVQSGQLLATFYSAQEAAELARMRSEFEAGVLERLRQPSDTASERALAAIRAQKIVAEKRLEERMLRAPRDGIVSDLRIRPGQLVNPGEVVLSLTGTNPTLSILALLPGQYRPQIRPGMPLRLELTGYPYAYQHLIVSTVGEDVLGPREARRLLDPGIADAVAVRGPVIFVEAELTQESFESDGQLFTYHDGMLATAEVRVRSEPMLLTLIPGLRALFGKNHAESENAS